MPQMTRVASAPEPPKAAGGRSGSAASPHRRLPPLYSTRKPHLNARAGAHAGARRRHLLYCGARADGLQPQAGFQTFFGDLSKRLSMKVGKREITPFERILRRSREARGQKQEVAGLLRLLSLGHS